MSDALHLSIYFDTCALDPKYWPENKATQKLLELESKCVIDVILPYSVNQEVDHQHTPVAVKGFAARMIYTLKPDSLNSAQSTRLKEIEDILAGNGDIKKIKKDALHIFECARASGRYFVTVDKGICKKKGKLENLFNSQLVIIKPSELLNLISLERANRNVT